MQLLKSRASAQRFLTTHAAVYDTFSMFTVRSFRGDAEAAWTAARA